MKNNFLKGCKLLLNITIPLLLSACASLKYADHAVKLQNFSNKKSIVITNMRNKDGDRVGYSFARIDNNYTDFYRRLRYRADDPMISIMMPMYDIYMIEPGVYAVEEIKTVCGNTTTETTSDGFGFIDSSIGFRYAGFQVKADEIVYLGDIIVDFRNAEQLLHPLDKYEDAVHYLRKKYPELSKNKVEKKLLKTTESFFAKKRE